MIDTILTYLQNVCDAQKNADALKDARIKYATEWLKNANLKRQLNLAETSNRALIQENARLKRISKNRMARINKLLGKS